MERGDLKLDDPVEQYLPQLKARQVLLPDAKHIGETEPARSAITIRQLLNHTSGLSYGLLDHGSVMYQAYNARKVMNPTQTLEEMMDVLSDLPLSFHPGTSWEYSIATDVLSRLVEVVSGMSFDAYLQLHIFIPLGMFDTGFVVDQEHAHRLTAYYAGSDARNVLKPGLKRLEKSPYPGAFLTPVPRLSGGGGLLSTMHDMIALIQSLLPDGEQILRPATIDLMMQNHLPSGRGIAFPSVGDVPGKGFGLGGAVTLIPSENDPAASTGEFEWGGIAGTHWWISPRNQIAGLLMTQRLMGFWHPYSFEFKKLAYKAMGY